MATQQITDLTSRLEELERGIRVLEDIEAIRNLKMRYAAYCDDDYNPDGIAQLFVEDAVWESSSLGNFQGREAIRGGVPGSIKDLHLCITLHLELANRSAWRYSTRQVVRVHALHLG